MSSSGALPPPRKADPPTGPSSYVEHVLWGPCLANCFQERVGVLEAGQAGPAGSWGPGGRPGTRGQSCWS